MTDHIFSFHPPVHSAPRDHIIPVRVLNEKDFSAWLSGQDEHVQAQVKATSFTAKAQKTFLLYDEKHALSQVIAGIADPMGFYDMAHTAAYLSKKLPKTMLESVSFTLDCNDAYKQTAALSWVLGAYSFDTYKKNDALYPALLVDNDADKKRIESTAQAISIVRNMVSTPANDMGPQHIESCVQTVADTFNASLEVTRDNDLIKNNFPLVYTVGEAAAEDRRPRLLDLRWGDEKHPQLTLVGKGVAFDTGGLNLKPTQYMATMKKDMGGAAHALGAAYMVMAMDLPVRLRLLIPAVENAVSAPAFRPGDVLKSRKGLAVENTNTDAEGRLILADALCYACEETPDLVIDFATLTGSARAALGHDIPAMFSTNEKNGQDLQKMAFDIQDPVWQMPLYKPYQKHIKSTVGDVVNSAGLPGDLIYSALFLSNFVAEEQDWIHIDCFAWESSGKAGRPKGGSDTGLRAVYAFLEEKYR